MAQKHLGEKSGKGVDGEPAPTLNIESLSLRRNGKWLFRNLNLEVSSGSFVAIVGPSGVGKTSFLHCLAGGLEPTQGQLYYHFPDDIRKSPGEISPRLGFIFQNFNLIENESVLTNVLSGRLSRYSFLRTLLGFPRAEKEDAYSILFDLGIAQYVHNWVAEISGGEKQRVCIARAIFQNPCVILADEPVSQLDSYFTGRVLGRFRQEAKEQKKTVFCVLHEPSLVNRFADLVLSFNPESPEDWNLRKVSPK